MKKEKFIKIQTTSQDFIPTLKKLFQSGTFIDGIVLPKQTYESNIPYILRFMIDKNIGGTGWLKVNAGYSLIPQKKKTTRC